MSFLCQQWLSLADRSMAKRTLTSESACSHDSPLDSLSLPPSLCPQQLPMQIEWKHPLPHPHHHGRPCCPVYRSGIHPREDDGKGGSAWLGALQQHEEPCDTSPMAPQLQMPSILPLPSICPLLRLCPLPGIALPGGHAVPPCSGGDDGQLHGRSSGKSVSSLSWLGWCTPIATNKSWPLFTGKKAGGWSVDIRGGNLNGESGQNRRALKAGKRGAWH